VTGLESGSELVFVVDLWCWRICIDNVATVTPDGLESTLQPDQLAVEAVRLEFAQEAMDVGGLAGRQRVGVIDNDAGCSAPRREPGPGHGRREHRGEPLEGEERALEEGGGHGEGDGAGDTGRGEGSMRADVEDEGGGVGEPGRELGEEDGGERGHVR